MRKLRAFLHQVIAQQTEISALRVDCSFIVERTILKVQRELHGYLIVTRALDQVTERESSPIEGTEHQKSARNAFVVKNSYRCRSEIARIDETSDCDQNSKRVDDGVFEHLHIIRLKEASFLKIDYASFVSSCGKAVMRSFAAA
jgi:hypothetical protein